MLTEPLGEGGRARPRAQPVALGKKHFWVRGWYLWFSLLLPLWGLTEAGLGQQGQARPGRVGHLRHKHDHLPGGMEPGWGEEFVHCYWVIGRQLGSLIVMLKLTSFEPETPG